MRKSTWWIVLAFLVGWLFAPLMDPAANVERTQSLVSPAALVIDAQLAAR